MRTVYFYYGEVIGSNNKTFNCYIEAKSACEAENKLMSYYDNHLMSTMGEMESVSIYDVNAEEYYKEQKMNRYIFI